jgi:hypothetical protein
MKALSLIIALSINTYAETIICRGSEGSYQCQELNSPGPDSYRYDPEYLEDVISVTESDYSGSDRDRAVSDSERDNVEETEEIILPTPVNPYFQPWFSPVPPIFYFK